MGKKRKFSRFIRWIRSDLPDENKSNILLLGVTKIPSPRFDKKSRPHTLHLDHNLSAKSQTIDTLPYPRTKLPLLTKSKSNDSLISDDELLPDIGIENRHFRNNFNGKIVNNKDIENGVCEKNNSKGLNLKRVSFQSDSKNLAKGVGFCTELPYEYYHPRESSQVKISDDLIAKPTEIMDKSVDSIGSCSLDVDASSTDFSDSSFGSSNYTLRSLLASTPTKEKVPKIHEPRKSDSESKKPSYLNLACQVNGYSGLTNYDSKLRENFRIPRSREVSPIRPISEYHVINDPINTSNKENNSKFLSPHHSYQQSSPSKMTESKSQTVLQTGYSYSSSTTRTVSYMSKESRNFTKSMLYEDKIDGCIEKNGRLNGKFSSFESNKISTYTNINGKERSYSETSTKESYFPNGQAQNGTHKSFIQQRVERLYGPAALAQGFFILNKKKTRAECENDSITYNDSFNSSKDTSFDSEIDLNMKQSCSSPSLPVLRHLRPEFRAQLPILSSKRVNSLENTMQKSTTVPLSLTTATNGIDKKHILNGSSKSVESIENKENIIQKQIIHDDKPSDKIIEPPKLISEEIPAAPKVILPLPKSEVLNGSCSDVNGNKSIDLNGDLHVKNQELEKVKDGNYFLKIHKNETDRLIKLAEMVEEEIDTKTDLSDEVLGYLRSASGKARLLVSQKMQQFEGLCHKNINQIPGEPFPTTAEDLQGFWDMVMLQVTQVDQLFADIDSYRKNNWVIPEKPKPDATDGTKPKKVIVIKKAVNEKAEAQRKQREAARKKMIEERRKAMKEKQQQEQGIEIFIPESS